MEINNKGKSNLANKKILYREVGIITALAIFLVSLTLKIKEKPEIYEITNPVNKSFISAPAKTTYSPAKNSQKPQPKVRTPRTKNVIEIVDKDLIIPDVPDVVKVEDEANIKIEIKEYYEEHISVKEVNTEEKHEEEIPFTMVEEKPQFQGGDENSFSKWIATKIIYPEIARENGVQGRVLIEFIVGKDGTISDVKAAREVNELLDKEAIRVISSSPKWKPGRQKHKPVKVKYIFPVVFQLR